MTTDWPHARDTASPSVRARMSTPPPAEYGTKICTGREGNGACAEPLPSAAKIAAMTAAVRRHRACKPSRKNLRLKASSRQRQRSGHVDNPADRVKFSRLRQDGRDHVAR